MRHTNYEIRLHAESYGELRDAIEVLAIEHGLLEAAGDASPARSVHVHPTLPESAASSAAVRTRAAYDQSKPEPVTASEVAAATEDPEQDPDVTTETLVWYHKPDDKLVWQEKDAGRRKGVYKVDEKTARELIEKYEAESGAEDSGEQEIAEAAEQEAAEEKEPAPEEDGPADQPALTLDDVRQAVLEYAKQNGATKGKALVNKFGVDKLSQLSEDQYPAVFAEASGEAA